MSLRGMFGKFCNILYNHHVVYLELGALVLTLDINIFKKNRTRTIGSHSNVGLRSPSS